LKSCPIVFRVDPAATPGIPYTLEATLVPSVPDRNPANNVDTHTGVVLAASDLELTGAVDVLRHKPGALVTYTFTLTNHGPQAAHDVGFNDELSPHLTAVSFEQTSGPAATIHGMSALIPLLAVGESATFRLVARAKTDFEAADIRNQASVRSPNLDLHDRDNDSIVWTFAGPDADLGVSSAQAAAVAPARIPVTIHVRNNGPDPVQHAVVRNALGTAGDEYDFVERARIVAVTASQGTCSAPEIEYPFAELPPPGHWIFDCTLGSLAVGAEARIDLVIERISGRGAMRLSSVVTPGQNDPRPADNARLLIIEEAGSRRRSVRK
jgi:uncharacterized repeat protein (TIGR01451 family)